MQIECTYDWSDGGEEEEHTQREADVYEETRVKSMTCVRLITAQEFFQANF